MRLEKLLGEGRQAASESAEQFKASASELLALRWPFRHCLMDLFAPKGSTAPGVRSTLALLKAVDALRTAGQLGRGSTSGGDLEGALAARLKLLKEAYPNYLGNQSVTLRCA